MPGATGGAGTAYFGHFVEKKKWKSTNLIWTTWYKFLIVSLHSRLR
jgi:hypothetical protein